MFKESKGQGDRHLAREGDSPPAVDESRAGWTARGPAHRSKQFRFHPMNDGKAAPGLEQRSDAIWSVCASPALAAVGQRGCREVRQAASGGRGGCPGAEAGGGGKNLSGREIPATRSWLRHREGRGGEAAAQVLAPATGQVPVPCAGLDKP